MHRLLPVAIAIAGCSETEIRSSVPELELSGDAFAWEGVTVGTVEARTVRVSNRGRGDLFIAGFALEEGGSAEFEPLEPEPAALAPDASLELSVTFAPTMPGERTGHVELLTNDPDRPVVSLALDAVATDPVLELDPPELWFPDVAPGGEGRQELRFDAGGTGTVEVTGVAFEDPAFADVFEVVLPDGLAFPLAIAAGTGVNAEVVFRPLDERTRDGRLLARHRNPTRPEAAVRLVGNGGPEPQRLLYVISGGDSPTMELDVDDDLEILVDDVPVFTDANTVRDTHPPIAFYALSNATVRIVATDAQTCEARLSALTLHFGNTHQQPLNSAICKSACDEADLCWDPDFEGPWPAIFLDERYPIAIP